jgi:ribA/ribD-fused uncharacterized protein
MDGLWYPTTEHYFQSMKMLLPDDRNIVRNARDPSMAAREGRRRTMRPDWEQIRTKIMEDALMAKFQQHQDLKDLLLGTGDAILVEHTRNDRFWADGGDGSGRNHLGLALMRVRQALRQ